MKASAGQRLGNACGSLSGTMAALGKACDSVSEALVALEQVRSAEVELKTRIVEQSLKAEQRLYKAQDRQARRAARSAAPTQARINRLFRRPKPTEE